MRQGGDWFEGPFLHRQRRLGRWCATDKHGNTNGYGARSLPRPLRHPASPLESLISPVSASILVTKAIEIAPCHDFDKEALIFSL
jgi:hypothetical protein